MYFGADIIQSTARAHRRKGNRKVLVSKTNMVQPQPRDPWSHQKLEENVDKKNPA